MRGRRWVKDRVWWRRRSSLSARYRCWWRGLRRRGEGVSGGVEPSRGADPRVERDARAALRRDGRGGACDRGGDCRHISSGRNSGGRDVLHDRRRLLVNELAPRPHNSYHASERACPTSQFEQLVRAICCLPLGDVEVVQPAAIANLLGDLWMDERGQPREPHFDAALAVPGCGCISTRSSSRARGGRWGIFRRWVKRRKRRWSWCYGPRRFCNLMRIKSTSCLCLVKQKGGELD